MLYVNKHSHDLKNKYTYMLCSYVAILNHNLNNI